MTFAKLGAGGRGTSVRRRYRLQFKHREHIREYVVHEVAGQLDVATMCGDGRWFAPPRPHTDSRLFLIPEHGFRQVQGPRQAQPYYN